MKSIKDYMKEARRMLGEKYLNKSVYSEIEDFILRSGSRYDDSDEFIALKDLMDEVADKFGIRKIESIRENFGLNSCAQ